MCGVCGCGEGETKIEGQAKLQHTHAGGHDPVQEHNHGHSRTHAHEHSDTRLIRVEQDILSKNNEYAAANRRLFNSHGMLAINLLSAPGSGKTTLLTRTLNEMKGDFPMAVIEGDQQTSLDADRIRATGARVTQINTGKGCHLDAHMVGHALEGLKPEEGGALFIENVGNLVCPAAFDLGEAHKAVILSVTEGEDKPLKYPDMFHVASLMLLNKIDLLPHLDFDVETCINDARRVNPGIKVLMVSAKTGEGMGQWYQWLRAVREVSLTGHATVSAAHAAAGG